MAARITILSFRRPRLRAKVTRIGFDPGRIVFGVTCACGHAEVLHTKDSATRAKREHDAAHRRAEAAHPAGKARRGATPGGAA